VTFQDCVTMMFVDAIWMGVLSWYIAKIWPSEFGTHQPFYFLCLPSYWKSCFGCRPTETIDARSKGELVNDAEVSIEDVTENLTRQLDEGTCVDIKDLYKVFNTTNGKKVAVDGLNLTMYSGQVTALLGHNGAGKVIIYSDSLHCSFLFISSVQSRTVLCSALRLSDRTYLLLYAERYRTDVSDPIIICPVLYVFLAIDLSELLLFHLQH
jgi:hypothetical protein